MGISQSPLFLISRTNQIVVFRHQARQSGLSQLLPLRPSQALALRPDALAPNRTATGSFAQPRPWLRRILKDPRRRGHPLLLLLLLLNSPALPWMRTAMREDTLNLVRQSFLQTFAPFKSTLFNLSFSQSPILYRTFRSDSCRRRSFAIDRR